MHFTLMPVPLSTVTCHLVYCAKNQIHLLLLFCFLRTGWPSAGTFTDPLTRFPFFTWAAISYTLVFAFAQI